MIVSKENFEKDSTRQVDAGVNSARLPFHVREVMLRAMKRIAHQPKTQSGPAHA